MDRTSQRHKPRPQHREPTAIAAVCCMKKTNLNTLTSGSVLYYPTIEFQSDTWLKAAICVWEKVYRIVPPSYKPQDSDEVKEAMDAGLVESIKLENGDLASAAVDFQSFMDEADTFPAALQGHDNIDVRIHPEKIDARLLPLFESLASKIDPQGFLSVSEEVADAYMLYLATNIARRRKIGKATDDEQVFSVDSYFQFDGNFSEYIFDENQAEVAATVVLPQLLPSGLETDSMERVLNFRNRFAEARASYRENVLDLAKLLTTIESSSHVRDIIEDFRNKLTGAKHASAGRAIATISEHKYAALAIGLPIAAAAFLDGGKFQWSVALGGIGIGLIATMADANKSKRSAWKKSDAFYHLALHNYFGWAEGRRIGLPRISDKFHEFMDD